MSNNSHIAKNTIFLYIRMLFVMLVTLYTSRVVLQTLGETDFGIFNVVGGVVAMMSFFNSAMTSGFQRYLNFALGKNDIEGYKQIFKTSFAIQIIITIIALLLSETIGVWFLNTYMVIPQDRVFAANIVFQSAVIIFVVNIFISPFSAVIISYEKMNIFAFIGIAQTLAKLGIVFLLTSFNFDKLIFYSVLLIFVDIFVLITYYICTKHINKELSIIPLFDKSLIKSMMSFSGWNLLGSLAHLMKGNGLNIVLNLFFGPSVNAARGIAYQVSGAVTSLYSNFQMAVRPQVIKFYAIGNIKEVLRLSYMMSRLSFILMLIPTMSLIFVMDFVMKVWLDNNVPSLAPMFARIVLVTCVIESLATPLTTIVHATGKMKKFQTICSTIILMIVPIAYIVLKLGAPPQAALYTSLIIVAIVHGIRLILLKELIPFSIKEYLKAVILPCLILSISSFIIPMFLYTINTNPWILIFVTFIITSILSFFIGLTKQERYSIIQKIKLY